MIEKIVTNIFDSIEYEDDNSLLKGSAGQLLFAINYLNYNPQSNSVIINNGIGQIEEASIENGSSSFCMGKSGINWLYAYLYKKKLISHRDFILSCHDSKIIQEKSIWDIKQGNYDFLHGALGVAYSTLYSYRQSDKGYIKKIYEELELLIDNSHSVIYEYVGGNGVNSEEFVVNIGLAHGLPSILKFCIQCYKQKVHSEKAKVMAYKLIDFLMKIKQHQMLCYFPGKIKHEEHIAENSRLGWCYGDLGVAYTLYHAGLVFDDLNVQNIALDILKQSTNRKSPDTTVIYDAGICHGSAGVAHFYNRLWHLTRVHDFKIACDFWINQTINYYIDNDVSSRYKKYNPSTNTHENDYSLLEGEAGIGLVFLSYLTGDFSWDYCLMLND